jgi:glycosyltransferase involved in cell wall biosynthesis
LEQRYRICHVITRMIVGGAQENTLYSVMGQMANGHEVVLLSGPSPGPEGELLAAEKVPGLQLVVEPTLVRDLAPLTDIKCYFALRRYFRENPFDIVHTHSSKAGILARLAARAAGVPTVVHTVHGQAFYAYQAWWRNQMYIWAERLAARSSDRIFAVAQAMIDQCVAAGVAPREKYRVVYSGMDVEAFMSTEADPDLRAELGIPPDALVVGKIARLFEMKGHDFLIEAAPRIVAEHPNVKFLLVGDGSLREPLEKMIADRDLQENFVFSGLVPPSEVCRYTALMDVLVHLSLREGLPRTVVQALASGVPAVGFALDGTPEVVLDGKTGFVCRPEDVDQVTDSVLKLLGDPELRRSMGENGRDLVRERFPWQRMVDVLEAEYAECVKAAD